MFTGQIEDFASVLWIRTMDRDALRPGHQLTFDLLRETLDRTNLRSLCRDSVVKLERTLQSRA